MKQIVDKLNKIAKKIDESVEIPQTDLIIDSLDAITKAYGGTPNDSNLIVDKLDDIAGVAHSGITPSGNIAITENTAEGEPLNVSQYATATVNVSGGGGNIPLCTLTVIAPRGTGSTASVGWLAFVDNILQKPIFTEGNNTVLLPYYDDEGATIEMGFQPNAVFSFSNPVNIDLEENDWPYIIDETQDSSLTVTVTSWGGIG